MTQNPWHWIIDETWPLNEKIVALVLKRHANAEGWSWPSAERISRLAGISRASVYRALKSLGLKGALERNESGVYVKYRVRQQQGLLFSTANTLWESSANHEEIARKAEESRLLPRPACIPGRREVRTCSEDRKPGPTRATPARGTGLWKLEQKARRILGDIERIKEIYVGCGNDGEAIARRDQRLNSLYAELERIGYGAEKAG